MRKVFKNNIVLLRGQRRAPKIHLYCNSFCLPPYIGFKLGKTIHALTFFTEEEADAMLKDTDKFMAAVNDLLGAPE
ncbi:hypothetical protein LCGC14_0356200 [marine sediment metagenome]|uniref:Uncharacterized protein n=1 Tax=marine sediment metagenome TaxID=412755 RepID=A0A0F9WHM3_9ZZZZ